RHPVGGVALAPHADLVLVEPDQQGDLPVRDAVGGQEHDAGPLRHPARHVLALCPPLEFPSLFIGDAKCRNHSHGSSPSLSPVPSFRLQPTSDDASASTSAGSFSSNQWRRIASFSMTSTNSCTRPSIASASSKRATNPDSSRKTRVSRSTRRMTGNAVTSPGERLSTSS